MKGEKKGEGREAQGMVGKLDEERGKGNGDLPNLQPNPPTIIQYNKWRNGRKNTRDKAEILKLTKNGDGNGQNHTGSKLTILRNESHQINASKFRKHCLRPRNSYPLN